MALLEFRSKAAGGFFMLPETFKEVCRVIGYPYATSGSWPAETLSPMILLLDKAIAEEKVLLRDMQAEWERKEAQGRAGYPDEDELDEIKRRKEHVSFAMRVYPLLEMMRQAQKKDVPVMWGVP